MKGKLVIISAPSGSGKTTIVKHLLQSSLHLEFSVSACNREKREGETDGKDYYFLSDKAFKEKIEKGEFVEWEEVYPGRFYGTLKSELQRIWKKGNHVLFDVDVVGGVNLKRMFKDDALAVFVKAPSAEEIEKRLRARSSDNEDSIGKRVAKIKEELRYEPAFDKVIINDRLDEALDEAEKLVADFLKPKDGRIKK